jgi:hypothetical protein
MPPDRLTSAAAAGMLVDLNERPDLCGAVDRLVASNLPVFMTWASPGNWRWHRLYELYPRFQLACLDKAGAVVAAVHSVPMPWDDSASSLPDGYDEVLVRTASRSGAVGPAGALCLLSISVRKDLRGSGMAICLVAEMKRRARAERLDRVIGPLRPTRKAAYPFVDMAAYLEWKSEDGSAFDPWLRQHLALGAQVLGIARRSLVIAQPRGRWEQATGRDMSVPALYAVEGALAPVEIDISGIGTYAEPNVWIMHWAATRDDLSSDRSMGVIDVRH